MKGLLILILLSIFTSLMACNTTQKVNEITAGNNYLINKDNILKENSNLRNLDKKDFSYFKEKNLKFDGIRLNDDYNIILSEDLKYLKKINSTTGETENLVNVQNNNFYIREFVVNENFIVWIEGDSIGFGSEYEHVIEWSIYNKNLKTNEINLIDKSKYTRDNLELKNYESYEPNSLDLSEENRLVYRAYDLENHRIVSKINFYDLEKETLKEIIRTKELIKECLFEPKISGDNISFIKGSEHNNDNSRQIFNYIDLFLYNTKENTLNQITKDMKITSSNILNDNIIFSASNENNELVDSLFIYNINNNSTQNLLYENSNAVKSLDKIGLTNIMIGPLDLDDKYIYIKIQGDYSPIIYNMESNEFISFKNEIDCKMKNNFITISKGNNRLIKIYIGGYDINDTLLEYKLN